MSRVVRTSLHLAAAALCVGLLALIAACATRVPELDYHESRGGKIEAPPDGQASVVFVRPRHESSGGWAIFDGESFVTLLGSGTYYVHTTSPGPHRFKSRVLRAWQHLDADLEAGLIYFVVIKPEALFFPLRRIELKPVLPGTMDDALVEEWIAQARRVEPNEAAFDWFRSNREQLVNEIREDSPGPRHHLPAGAGLEPRHVGR